MLAAMVALLAGVALVLYALRSLQRTLPGLAESTDPHRNAKRLLGIAGIALGFVMCLLGGWQVLLRVAAGGT